LKGRYGSPTLLLPLWGPSLAQLYKQLNSLVHNLGLTSLSNELNKERELIMIFPSNTDNCNHCGALPIDWTDNPHAHGNLLNIDNIDTNHINQFIVKSMGKWLKVTGVFASDYAANEWTSKNKDQGVVANFGPFVITAHMYDKGQNVKVKE